MHSYPIGGESPRKAEHFMSRAKSGLLGAVVAVLALGACSGALTPSVPAGNGPPVAGSVFSVGYDRISDVYLEPTDLGDLTVDGLAGLGKLDARLDARRVGRTVDPTSDRPTGGG